MGAEKEESLTPRAGRFGMLLHPIYHLVLSANRACTRNNCHGRGITAGSWSENMSPLGSGMYWPQSFYEEEICSCTNLVEPYQEELFEWVESQQDAGRAHAPTLYQMAHWGCKQCEIDALNEKRSDEGMYHHELISHILTLYDLLDSADTKHETWVSIKD